jgi:hypothetical protein
MDQINLFPDKDFRNSRRIGKTSETIGKSCEIETVTTPKLLVGEHNIKYQLMHYKNGRYHSQYTSSDIEVIRIRYHQCLDKGIAPHFLAVIQIKISLLF